MFATVILAYATNNNNKQQNTCNIEWATVNSLDVCECGTTK